MILEQNFPTEFPAFYTKLSAIERGVLIARLFKITQETNYTESSLISYIVLQIGDERIKTKKQIDEVTDKLIRLKIMHWAGSHYSNFSEKLVPIILQTIVASADFLKIQSIIEKRIYNLTGNWKKTVYDFKLLYKWVTWHSLSIPEFRQLTPKLTLGQYCTHWADFSHGLLPSESWWKQQNSDKQAELLLIFFQKYTTLYQVNSKLEDKAIAFLSENKDKNEVYEFMYYYGINALLKGRLDQLKLSLNKMLPYHRMIHEAVLMCFDGNYEEALPYFESGIAQWQHAEKIKYHPLADIAGIIYGYTLIVNNVNNAFDVFDALSKKTNVPQTEMFKKLYKYRDIGQSTAEFYTDNEETAFDFSIIFLQWLGHYYGVHIKSRYPENVTQAKEKQLIQKGAYWLAKEIRNSGLYKPSPLIPEPLNSNSILLIPKRESKFKTPMWEKWLNRMELAIYPSIEAEHSTRLIWVIDPNIKQLNAIEQKVNKNGSWSKGKRVNPYAVHIGEYVFTDVQDKRMKSLVEEDPYGWGNRRDYYFAYERGIAELAGRKNVYVAGTTNTPAEIRLEPPRITLFRDKANNYKLSYIPDYNTPVMINRVSFNVFEAYVQDKEQMKICEIINQMKGEFPQDSHERLFAWLNKIKEIVQLSGDLPAEVLGNIESLIADPRLLVKVVPDGTAFKGEIHVQPIPTEHLYMQAGKGHSSFMHKLDSGMVNVQRDLANEADYLRDLYIVLDTNEVKFDQDDFIIFLPGEEQLLSFMDAMQDPSISEIVRVEILKDQNNRVISFLKTSSINLHLNTSANWLQMHAEDVQLDEGMIIKFKDLLEFSRQSESNFLQLSNNEYVILSSKLKKRLQQMALLADFKGEEIIVHPLAALHLEHLTDDLENVSKSKKWEKAIAPFKETESLSFQVSSGLNGTLRNYQLDGYQWLCRRSEQGLGACLADDMGLGKTIQSIAVLLHRKEMGPALIVAPTSVCANWQSEIQLFAPSLRVYNIYEEDRQKLTEVLGPGDVLICSYGLVTNETLKLSNIQFASVILDEAQAIKNPETKRSKAVWKLQAKAKWVTTGTPIENRLQELWSIFRFINPGLLGSLQQFREKYVYPIENQNNEWVAGQLKALISPFLLRRTKQEVLTDLPPKTEINRFIIPGKEELAMYEAIRIKAKEDLANAQNLPPGQRQIKIFSVLTQLRLASCHPSLVDDSIVAASSKQEALLELLGEILPGGHQVLIFSQFVKHLKIIREALDLAGITYLYLDGSTTPPQRKKLIASFEKGDSQVFLLSLKAGGTGINLTAASYVIHMDPWWNPAVEDQATDRAHRIGQLKNVTVYRMIMKHTLEEKILELHSSKRALSDQIISDQSSGVLDLNQVLQLIMN